MALLPQDQRSQVMMLVTMLALGGGYLFWKYYYQPTSTQISAAKTEIDSLQTIVDRAKQDLAQGTVEDLRQKVEQYRGMLSLMRRLVPEQNEVPALIDDMSTKAKVRGVTIGRIDPQAPEPGSPFDTYKYRLEILGHYDQLGEYLSDVASLPRVVVPQDLILKPASGGAQRLLGDTVGALLEADFAIRTFVKASTPGAPAPAGKKPPARSGGGQGQ
jgi:type IV pilus assembly protein PilO